MAKATTNPEFAQSPRHEFNFWFDPGAAHIVLRAHFPRIDLTTVDISIQALFTQPMIDQIAKSAAASHPAARYVAQWSQEPYYMWDEIAALSLLDPSIVTKETYVYLDVDIQHGPSYGNTLTWTDDLHPQTGVPESPRPAHPRPPQIPEAIHNPHDRTGKQVG